MIKITALSTGVCVLALVVGCARQYEKKEAHIQQQPVNCPTAESDIRVLQNEKTNVAQQVGMGVTLVAPIGLVTGLVMGTTGTKYRVTTGDYNKMIDAKIDEIQTACPEAT
jgi:hypothetical protein